MAVLLTISETLGGGAIAEALAGGGTGVDFGSVINSQYAPIGVQANNEGAQDLYISHDAVDDQITEVKTFIQEYGTGTGFTYGGANTAAGDNTALRNLGNSSGSSKNNADGNSGGLWIDMDWDASTVNQFDQGSFPSVVKIYGDNVTDGTDLSTAFDMETAAMVYDAPGETSASAPVTGQIGIAGDTVLGEAAHVKLRIYLPDSYADGGIVQWEWVIAYSYTS